MSRYRRFLPFVALLCGCQFMVGWSGPLRDQDLKVYRVSLPTVLPSAQDLNAREASGTTGQQWRVTDMRAVPDEAGDHDHFLLEIDFKRGQSSSTIAIQSSDERESDLSLAEGQTVRYAVSIRDARLVSTGPLQAPREPGRIVPIASPTGYSQGMVAQSMALIESRGAMYRYPFVAIGSRETASGSGAGREVSREVEHVSLHGLAAVGEKEFLTIERRKGKELQQYVTLIELPSTESPRSRMQDTDGHGTLAQLNIRPLIDLGSLGFTAEAAGLAVFSDARTLAVISGEVFDSGEVGSNELWLIRLPGSLQTSVGLVYVFSLGSVLLAVVLLALSLRRTTLTAPALASR